MILDPNKIGKKGLRSSSSDMAAIFHFWPNLSLVKVKHGKLNQVLSVDMELLIC